MSGDPAVTSRSPQNPHVVVARTTAADRHQVHLAVGRARLAGQQWNARGATDRSEALRAAAGTFASRARELEDLVVQEVGKPRAEARGEVARAVAILHYYSQQALAATGHTYPPSGEGLLYTERRPYGVAGLITPWNFPLAIPLWKAAPALAVGNAVVLKPSSDALACAWALEELLAQSLPEGLFTVVPGEAGTGEALVEAADAVSFTGSSSVGNRVAVAATHRGVPVQAEMGGQNAAIVLPDADPGLTAAQLAVAAMGFAGQKCTATRRVLVVGDPAPLTEALAEAIRALTVGDPADPSTAVGPLISASAQEAVLLAAAEARASGGRLVPTGGAAPTTGWYAAPVLVEGLDPGHRLNNEETFGPFLTVTSVPDCEDAARLSNSVRYGLVTSVHGQDLGAVLHTVAQLDTGLIKVNAPTTGVDFYAPFGGEKASSQGPKEQGQAGLDFYSSSRTVTIAPGARRFA